MPATVACPVCRATYSVDDSMVGKMATCGGCRTKFPAQAASGSSPPAAGPVPGSPVPVGAVLGKRYRVEAELGRGAFGVALRAFDLKMERDVALKMLLPEALASPAAVLRFQQEAKLLADVGHANVVPIFDKGRHGDSHFLVCKLVRGKTLAELMPKTGFADPRVAVGYAVTLGRTLHGVYADHAILHRDVKPANMMLEKDHLYLMDFGLAACHDKTPADDDGTATAYGSVVGTPAYMPPEQAVYRREMIGPWSDLYSAGAVLYHFLAGVPPLPWKGNPLHVLEKVPPPPSRHRPGLDPALDALVLKALEKPPERRYRDGREFADALQGWLDGTRTASGRATPLATPPAPPREVRWPQAPAVGNATVVPLVTAADLPRAKRAPERPEPAAEPPPPTKVKPERGKGPLLLLAALVAALLLGGIVLAVVIKTGGSSPTRGTGSGWK